MAKVVGYCQNNDFDTTIYDEGPFVACQLPSGYRVEVALSGHRCPVLPDLSIYKVCDVYKKTMRGFKEDVSGTVDFLNGLVKAGRISPDEKGWWIHP